MTGIGGPGGIGGPKRPDGPDSIADASELDPAEHAAAPTGAAKVGASELDALAADLASGKLTAREAVERLVDQVATSDQLGQVERAELRELITDLVANDPYLAGLVGRLT